MKDINEVYKQILAFYDMTEKQMKRKTRKKPWAFFRHCAMKYLYENYAKPMRISQQQLTEKFFCKDRSVISYASREIDGFKKVNAPEWYDYLALCNHMDKINGKHAEEYPTLYPVFFNQLNKAV